MTAHLTLGGAQQLFLKALIRSTLSELMLRHNTAKAVEFFGGSTPVHEITNGVVAEWQRELLAGGYRPVTIGRYVCHLQMMLGHAYREGLLQQLPRITGCPELEAAKAAIFAAAKERSRIRRQQRLQQSSGV